MRAQRGFTLIEMLLVVLVVLLLASVSVIYFGGLLQGSQLNEGTTRFGGLIRFVRAEAANSGRKLQIQFAPLSNSITGLSYYQPVVTCEREPLNEPGVFTPIDRLNVQSDSINDLVCIASVRLLGTAVTPAEEEVADNAADLYWEEDEGDLMAPPITFFPDGSSDSVEITLVSADQDDDRRMQLRLNGITGSIATEALTEELAENELDTEPSWESLVPAEAAEPIDGF